MYFCPLVELTLLTALPLLTQCHIFRESCGKSAHFKSTTGWRSSVDVIKAFENVNKRDCAFKCMFEDDCHSVNFKIGSGDCELLVNGTEGHTDAEWSFYTTGTDANKVGALCEKWSPCKHVCIDVCDANNRHTYVCLESFNVARQGEVTIPHSWGDNTYPAHLVIDGDHSTHTATGSGHGYTWVKIDLRYLFYVKSVRLYPRPSYISRSVNMVVQSSVDDTEYFDYGLTVATMPYSDYPINAQARFVKLERLNTAQSIFDGAEIEVYI